MSQKLPVNNFKWVKNPGRFYKNRIKNYNENGNKKCFFQVDIEYSQHLRKQHNDLPFLSERTKFNKCQKLICNLYDYRNYAIHIKAIHIKLK